MHTVLLLLAVSFIQEILLIPSILWNASSLCTVCSCWTVWKISQGISSPSFRVALFPEQCTLSFAFVHSRFSFWEQKLLYLVGQIVLWLISLSIRISFFVLTQNLSLYFSKTECTKMYFLQCCLLSLLFLVFAQDYSLERQVAVIAPGTMLQHPALL